MQPSSNPLAHSSLYVFLEGRAFLKSSIQRIFVIFSLQRHHLGVFCIQGILSSSPADSRTEAMPLHRIYSVKGVFSADDKKVRILCVLSKVGSARQAPLACDDHQTRMPCSHGGWVRKRQCCTGHRRGHHQRLRHAATSKVLRGGGLHRHRPGQLLHWLQAKQPLCQDRHRPSCSHVRIAPLPIHRSCSCRTLSLDVQLVRLCKVPGIMRLGLTPQYVVVIIMRKMHAPLSTVPVAQPKLQLLGCPLYAKRLHMQGIAWRLL